MCILAIDTSNRTLTVAVVMEQDVVEETITDTLQHSVRCMPAIEHVLAQANVQPAAISKIVVAQGPGSYTGLRIGVTIAKTMAKALDCSLVGVSSLAVLACNLQSTTPAGTLIVPFFDARRLNVFTGAYQVLNGQLFNVLPEVHQSWRTWLTQLAERSEPIVFVGEMSEPLMQVYEEVQRENSTQWQLAPLDASIPHASVLAQLGEKLPAVDADIFTPTYLKLAEAEEQWQAAHPNEEETNYVERV